MMTEEHSHDNRFKPFNLENCLKSIHSDGYILVRCPQHPAVSKKYPYMREQRIVMENYLGRYLTKNEVVHHKDGNRQNNNIENLELMTKGQHITHHKTGNKNSLGKHIDTSDRICFRCGSKTTFVKYPSTNNKKSGIKTPYPVWLHLPWDKDNWYCYGCYFKSTSTKK